MIENTGSTEKKQRLLSTITFLLGAVLSYGMLILGILVLRDGYRSGTPAAACFALLLLGTILNMLLAVRRGIRLARRQSEEGVVFLLATRETAPQRMKEILRLLCRLRRLTWAYAAAVLLIALAGSFFLGGLQKIEPGILLWWPFAFFSGAATARLPLTVRGGAPSGLNSLPEEDFPLLWSICKRAADAIGCRDELKLYIHGGTEILVNGRRGECQVHLGIDALLNLTRDEFYESLLRALAPSANLPARREARYAYWMQNGRMAHVFAPFCLPVFRFLDAEYDLQTQLCAQAAVFCEWENTVKAIRGAVAPRVAASSLLRMRYFELWQWEEDNSDFPQRQSYGELFHDLLEVYPEEFRRATATRREDWDRRIEDELLSPDWPDITLREKLRSLGVEKPVLLPYEISPEYRAELRRAGDRVDDADDRKNYEDKQRMSRELLEKWEAEGQPLRPESFGEVITALRTVGRIRDAFAFCDRAIDELPYTASIAYPSFVKGCKLLHSWDEKGLTYVYRAMEGNNNYIESGLNIIADFCRFAGNREALTQFEERSPALLQRLQAEHGELSSLKATDELRREELPEELRETLLRELRAMDGGSIGRVYLVRKILGPGRFTSVMIVEFKPDASPEQKSVVMRRLDNLLDDSTTWQFSLFNYDEVRLVPWLKIEGCVFYEGTP